MEELICYFCKNLRKISKYVNLNNVQIRYCKYKNKILERWFFENLINLLLNDYNLKKYIEIIGIFFSKCGKKINLEINNFNKFKKYLKINFNKKIKKYTKKKRI